jgi:leucyl aminopeptidase (aminopeptidase T)
MDGNLLERYADLIVSVGANVQPDQVLAVEALPEAQPLVAAIARRAYEKGARYVDVQYFDPQVKRIRAEYAPEQSLDWVPPWPAGACSRSAISTLPALSSCRSSRPACSTASTPPGRGATGCRRFPRRSR